MNKIQQVLKFEKSTKGTHFFAAQVPEMARVKSLYIQKEAFEGITPPAVIIITIEEASSLGS